MAAQSSHRSIICLTGPESSGKSTLANCIAQRYGITLVPEVAREYLHLRPHYTRADVLEIVRLQLEAEGRALQQGAPVVLDTDVTVLWVWWQVKYGVPPKLLSRALRDRAPRSYLLLRPDLPWQPDAMRENPHDREQLFTRYARLLTQSPHPFSIIEGASPERETLAYTFVESRFGLSPLR